MSRQAPAERRLERAEAALRIADLPVGYVDGEPAARCTTWLAAPSTASV